MSGIGRRLRALVLSRAAMVALALLAIYALAGFLLAPWLVRQQLPTLVEKRLGAQGSVAEVRINPFLLTFEASDLAITEKNGTQALQVTRLFIDFEASSLLRWAWTFREIRVEGPVINVELDSGGHLNFARLLAATQTADAPAPGPARPPRLLLRQLIVAGGSFRFTDHTLDPAARTRLDPVSFEVNDVSTLPDRHGEHVLIARMPRSGILEWQGRFT
ncbi:MAG: DUF748 domain-containing protein, partial [Burkholderiales bacterium]|nr:DUF748 domain-containing protein [Burkholderiales bacterium]